MTVLDRYRVLWSGFPGGPGVSTFYNVPGNNLLDELHTFFAAIADRLPNNVTLTFPNAGDSIEDTTGAIVGSWSVAAQANVVGSGATVYAAPVGVHVRWLTNTIINGRKLQGRTFIVPVIGQETAQGAPDAVLVNDVKAAADALVAVVGGLSIWHRPFPNPAAANGASGPVTGAVVQTKFSVLRSRRD